MIRVCLKKWGREVMKPALRYYGGKQGMLKYIMPLLPEHKVYVEPFCGGATPIYYGNIKIMPCFSYLTCCVGN